jgi:hypothetical protein
MSELGATRGATTSSPRRPPCGPAPTTPPPLRAPAALPTQRWHQSPPVADPGCISVEWSGASRGVVNTLAALGAGVEFIATEHQPNHRTAASLHLPAFAATVRRACGCEASLAATGQPVGPAELFGWAYERPTGRLLRSVPYTPSSWLPERRRSDPRRLDYGPFAPIGGTPQDRVWFTNLNDLKWGFTCLLVPAAAPEQNAQAIAGMTTLIDHVLLSRPGDADEAFHWDLHPGSSAAELVGYDAWTVRTSPGRIIVIRLTTSHGRASSNDDTTSPRPRTRRISAPRRWLEPTSRRLAAPRQRSDQTTPSCDPTGSLS